MKPTPSIQKAPASSWYALGVLVLIYMIGFTDRQILAIMIAPVQSDLHLTDVQIGLLLGFAFAIFFCTVGLFAGWAIDRFDRRIITLLSVIFWSVCCCLCGTATGFSSLFAARVGVGVGEGTMTPGGYSLISDLFPKRQLGLALSVYTMGANLGVGMSFVVGGAIAAFAGQFGPLSLPVVGHVRTWQFTFIILGLVGVLVAPLLMTFPEPIRHERQEVAAGLFGPLVGAIRERSAIYFSLLLGFALNNAIGMAILSWAPASLERYHHWSQSEAGLGLGLTIVCGG